MSTDGSAVCWSHDNGRRRMPADAGAVHRRTGQGEAAETWTPPFHAALVQKSMYEQVSPEVYVYAPEGPDVRGHLELIERYNQRAENPTAWTEHVYTGPDFLERMLREKKGNVVVLAGNNARKTDYIYRCVDAGFHVLADKPMVITPEDFPLLERAFERARANGVLLYDIMTAIEITTILAEELSQIPAVLRRAAKARSMSRRLPGERASLLKYVRVNRSGGRPGFLTRPSKARGCGRLHPPGGPDPVGGFPGRIIARAPSRSFRPGDGRRR